MNGPEKVLALAAYCGELTPEADAFRLAVERKGIVWTDNASSSAPVVVFMTDPKIAPDQSIISDREVLPVLFVPAYPEAFKGMSKLYPQVVGPEIAASQLADTIRNGPSMLVEWARLVDEARSWKADGDTAHLLSEARQPSAYAALGSERGKTSLQSDLVRTFIETSAQHSRKVRRRKTTILTTIVAVLTAALVSTALRTLAAKVAYDQSITEANNAEANRLTDLALRHLERDPDLPFMLADTATQLSTEPSVRTAAGRVARAQIAHTSHDLKVEGIPQKVTTSDTGRIAITISDESAIDVYEINGRQIDSIKIQPKQRNPNPRGAFISPDGSEVAFDDGVLRIFSIGGTSRDISGWTQQDSIEEWWDDEHLLVKGDGTADLLNVKTGKRDPLAGEELGQIEVAKPSMDGSVIALSDGKKIQTWDLDKRRIINEAKVPGITDLAVNNDGSFLIGASYPHAQIIVFEAERAIVKPATGDWGTVGVEALGDGYFAASDRLGKIAIYSSNSVTATPILRFQAHLSDKVRIANTPKGDLVSIGFDRKLRIWSTSDLLRLGKPTPTGIVTADASIHGLLGAQHAADSFPTATLRNQVRIGPTGLANVVLSAKVTARIVNPDDPTLARAAFVSGTWNRLFLSRDGKHLVIAHSRNKHHSGVLEILSLNAHAHDWSQASLSIPVRFPLGPGGTLIGPVIPAVAPEASTVALATSSGLSVWDKTGKSIARISFRKKALPLAISVDEHGKAQAITADGILHSTAFEDINLRDRWPASYETAGLTAAEFASTGVYLLNEAGAVARYRDKTIQTIVPDGTLSGLGTLRVSRDGLTILSIAPDALTVIRDGQVIARQPTRAGIPVEDAALADHGLRLVSVSAIGTVASHELRELSLDPLLTSPREYSETERIAFGLGEADG